VIVGEEVETYFPDTGQWIHVNVFDVDETTHADITRLRPNVHELVPYLRSRRLLHVLNHPFQSYHGQKPAIRFVDEILSMFDHFEIGNGNLSARHNRAVREMLDLAATHFTRKHGVGGSDAHHLRDIGLYWTEAEAHEGEDGKRGWLAAVALGETTVSGRSVGALGLTANVYRTIGRYYLSLLDPEVRREMHAENYIAAAGFVPVCIAGIPFLLGMGHSARLEVATLLVRRALSRMKAEAIADVRPTLLEDPLD
jgi:predicted metal-dependent phosphoesterase TrpH